MKHKQIISALLFAVLLFCTFPHAVIAEGEPFVCNCDTLPFALEPKKVREQQYTPAELLRWTEHRLAHTRIPEMMTVPHAGNEERAAEIQQALQEFVGERGSVVCEKPYDGLDIFQLFVYAPEEVIAELMPKFLEAGIWCDCAVYHEIPVSDSDAPFRMPSYITHGSDILWNPDAALTLCINEEKVARKEYTRRELLMYIENEFASSDMRSRGELYMQCVTDDAKKLADELEELTGASVTFDASFLPPKKVFFFIQAEESALPQVMLALLSEGFYVSLNEVTTFPENQPFVCGDLDFDRELQGIDYMVLKRIVLGTYTPAEEQAKIADVNCDGTVDAQDYMTLKRHVLGTYKITQGKLIDLSSYWS